MQKLFSLFIILLLSVAAFCQNNDSEGSVLLNTEPNWERLLKNKAKKPLINGYQFPQNQMPITASADTARYSHRTSKGNVYILPQDNMPCLVPDKQNVAAIPNLPSEKYLPNPSLPSLNNMPNAFGQRQLIFEKPAEPAKK